MTSWQRPAATACVALVALAAACSSGGDEPTASPVRSETAAAATDPEPVATEPEASDGAPSTEAATTTIGTVPDTGVPGIDSADPFCRSWSEFAGSFQALALVASFGDADSAVRLEVVASPAVIGAVDGLDRHLPPEIEEERDALVSDLAGPMLRRATRARAELSGAGLSDDAIEILGTEWLAAIAAAGLDDPDIALVVPDGAVFAGFADAVDAFGAAVPPIDRDPSLITDARVPLTEQYLSENCPDQGTLGGNDVVDEI